MNAAPNQLHYLESLDSIRVPWPGDDWREFHELHVYLEVLMVLALGRDVVVPQPYAFDSYAFTTVATRVLRARDRSGADDHPFRLHLYGADSYGEAVAHMLSRVHDRDYPFHSSLVPELQDPARFGLDPDAVRRQSASLDRLLSSAWIGDGRAEAMELIHREFRRRPRAGVQPAGSAATLDSILRAVVDDGSAVVRAASEEGGSLREEVWHGLRTAIRRLDPTAPGAFDQRSRLRRVAAWPGDPEGRSPAEIVGGRAELDLVIEFVDTLYNRVVSDSIGDVAQATFTTITASADDESLLRRAIAQDLALTCYAVRSGHRPPARPAAERTADGEPEFQVRIDAAAVESNDAVRTELRGLVSSLDDGLGSLLAERGELGTTGRARSTFWTGLDEWKRAVAGGNAIAARKAQERHFKHVVGLLGAGARVTDSSSWRESLVSGGASNVPAFAAELLWPDSMAFGGAGLTLGIVAPLILKRGSKAKERRTTTRLAGAFSRVLDVDGSKE